MNIKLMTVDQLAEFLQVSTETIRRYTRSGKLKCVKVGHQMRFTKEQIDAFLNANVAPETTEADSSEDLQDEYY